jgi:hypothetical protein
LRKIVRLSVGVEGGNHDDTLVKKKDYRLQTTGDTTTALLKQKERGTECMQ